MTREVGNTQNATAIRASLSNKDTMGQEVPGLPFAVFPTEVSIQIISCLDEASRACLALTSRHFNSLVSIIHPSDDKTKPRKLTALCRPPKNISLSLYGKSDFELLHRRLVSSTSRHSLQLALRKRNESYSQCETCTELDLEDEGNDHRQTLNRGTDDAF